MEQKLKPLHLACSTDELRPNMSLIQIKNNHATATDGHICVRVDLSETSTLDPESIKLLNGKFIHREVWKEIHKCDSVEFDDNGIYCHKNGIKKTFEYAVANGSFFDIDNVIEDLKRNGDEAKTNVCYNPSLITIIGKIFQESQLEFSFSKGNLGTIVFPYNESGMFAVLMPKHIEGPSCRYFFN